MISFPEALTFKRKGTLYWKMDKLKTVEFKIVFVFSLDGVEITDTWNVVFFMISKKESVDMGFMKCFKCKRHVFILEFLNILQRKEFQRYHL